MNISKIKLQRLVERRRAKWLEIGDNIAGKADVGDIVWSTWEHVAA